MQKTFAQKVLISVLALLFIIAGGAYLWATTRLRQQQAILSVITQAIIHPGDKTFSMPLYTSRLNQIQTVGCPEAFQLAWSNYVQTIERAGAPLAGSGLFRAAAISTAKPSTDALEDALRHLDQSDPRAAMMRVQVVSMRYGVQTR